jgi:hypothetical protein
VTSPDASRKVRKPGAALSAEDQFWPRKGFKPVSGQNTPGHLLASLPTKHKLAAFSMLFGQQNQKGCASAWFCYDVSGWAFFPFSFSISQYTLSLSLWPKLCKI